MMPAIYRVHSIRMPPTCNMTWSHVAQGGVINTLGEGIYPSDMVLPPWSGPVIGIVPYNCIYTYIYIGVPPGPGFMPGLSAPSYMQAVFQRSWRIARPKEQSSACVGQTAVGPSIAGPRAFAPREVVGSKLTRPDLDSRPLLWLGYQLCWVPTQAPAGLFESWCLLLSPQYRGTRLSALAQERPR